MGIPIGRSFIILPYIHAKGEIVSWGVPGRSKCREINGRGCGGMYEARENTRIE
jgi:hypothetical protein